MFGKYRFISTLGTGSSSTVYLAEHLKLKLYRAIKCIPKSTAQTASFLTEDRFPAEAVLLKNLRHPGIPLIYDIDEDDDFIYMIEEYIQGDTLDVFLSHQTAFSQEMVIEFGIQLCDIIDYLHRLSPYPILYQDLKPEHIIVCGNQLKLVDFGIAFYFSDCGSQFQHYGTDGFIAPESLNGKPISPLCDIYSLGKILEYIIDITDTHCSEAFLFIIKKACALCAEERFDTAAGLKEALIRVRSTAYKKYPHLIRNIFVAGCKSGAGTTHIAVSIVSTLNKLGISSIYTASQQADRFPSMTQYHPGLTERDGIYSDNCFCGIPAYGSGIIDPVPENTLRVKDCGCLSAESVTQCEKADFLIIVLSGSDWDMSDTLSFANQIKSMENLIFICNYGNHKAAKKLAKLLRTPVYCFPSDKNAYCPTPEKERLVSALFQQKGGINKFLALIKKRKKRI